EMFSINENMTDAPDDEIKGVISRITGKEEKDVKRLFTTFNTLCNYVDFSDIKIIDNNWIVSLKVNRLVLFNSQAWDLILLLKHIN
ncbi:DUF5343 domain-containing protein, partial [Listeria monocytogenes]|nr:DUF5343 domain-containing protein [Listeria monocytogenes]